MEVVVFCNFCCHLYVSSSYCTKGHFTGEMVKKKKGLGRLKCLQVHCKISNLVRPSVNYTLEQQ